jgi:hypothetical protein
VDLGILVPLVIVPILIVGCFVWYRRSIAGMRPTEAPPVSGVRLTAEALHRSASPPWRVVYEIGDALGTIDHVVVGPAGVIAIRTVVADRPEIVEHDDRSAARAIGDAAIARLPVDELLRAVGARCDRSATIFWGTPDPRRPAVHQSVAGHDLVEGQRLHDWLAGLVDQVDTPLDQTRIDTIWRTIVVGIGRPHPD